MKRISAICTILFIGSQCGFTQGFVNLDFESADPSGVPQNGDAPIGKLLPGWSGSYGNNQASVVFYDAISIGGYLISVVDTNVGFSFFYPIQGNYSVYLFGGEGGPLLPATISQTAMVPVGTESLRVDLAGSGLSLSLFSVSINGQTINMVPLEAFANYTQYAGDISSFAGQVSTLSFTEAPPIGTIPPSFVKLDDIQFSVSPVPEPGTLALFATGALLLAFRRRPRSPNWAMLRS